MNFPWRPFNWKRSIVLTLSFAAAVLSSLNNAEAQSRPMGTDVSSYQGSGVNWSGLRTDGLSFAWAKATEGTYFVDADFTINEAHAKTAGVYIGAYHFARPSDDPNITGANSADTEAQYFWNVAGSYVIAGGGYLVPMLDWEDPYVTNVPSLTETVMSQWVNEWCNDVSNYARANGVVIKPVVYTGTWYSEPSATYPGLNSSVTIWPSWIAAYPSCTKVGSTEECGSSTPQTSVPGSTYPWSTWNLWQYGDTNWSGGDSDVFNGTTNQFLQLFAIGSAQAPAGVTLYWDPSAHKASPGSGGAGNWDSTTPDWWYSGSSNVAWATAGDNAVFAGVAGTVTLNASVSAGSLTFQTGNYTIAGTSTLSLTNPATINALASTSQPETISCILTGSALTVTGGGTVIVNNTSSAAGSLTIGANTTFQAAGSQMLNSRATGITLDSGATFQNNDSVSGDTFLGSGSGIALGAGVEMLSVPNASLSFGGVISGPGSMIKSGAGTLTLTGASTYSGGTTVNQGVLAMGASGSIHNSSAVNIAAGGTFDVSLQSSWVFPSGIVASGAGTVAGSSASTIKGPSNGMVNMGTGAITLLYTPSTTNGDSIHPALYVSQGVLSMTPNNTIVISNASANPMGVGLYVLIQQASGGISNAPRLTPQIEGAGVSAGSTNYFVFTNQYLFFVVSRITTTTLSPLTASTYGQAATLTATVLPTPAGGTLQFYDNGIPLGKAVTVISGTASLTTNNLMAGNHVITAFYNGVTAYAASWSAPATQQVAPLPLAITANSQNKAFGQTFNAGPASTNITSSGLEPGDTIGSVTLTVSSNGASAGAPVGTYVITPSAATGGTFSTNNYNITYNSGTLTITLPPNSSPVTITGPFVQSDGTVQLSFAGVPGYTYYIQAAADIDPPIDWANISTNTADTNGFFNFIDLDATNYPVRFYRTQVQP